MTRAGEEGPRARAGTAAGYAVGAVLAQVARLRGGRPVHPLGVVYRARVRIDGRAGGPWGAELLSQSRDRPALVRFSRSLGLPRPLPDLLGAAVRVLDAYGPSRHQDFLMVTSVDLPLLHHLFVPATDFQQRPYSSSLPFRAGGDVFLVGLLPDPLSPRPAGGDELDRLARAAATGRLGFGLAVAPLGGRFRRIGSVDIEDRLPPAADAIRFDPFNSGGGLEPVGLLNRMRRQAYPRSQAAWAPRARRSPR